MPTTIDELQFTNLTRIVGQDELNAADVTEIGGKKRINVEVFDTLNTAIINSELIVGATQVEVKVGASRQANRKLLIIINTSSNIVYYGGSGVTVANGLPLFKNQSIMLGVGNIPLYFIAGSSGNSIRIFEGS